MARFGNLGMIHPHQPINWTHPLNRDRVFWGMVLPVRNNAKVMYDLCGTNDLTLRAANNYATDWNAIERRPGGWGHLRCNASDSAVSTTAGVPLKTDFPKTLAVWYRSIGTPTTNAAFFGMVHNSAASDPYNSYSLYGNGNLTFSSNSAGTFYFENTSPAIAMSSLTTWTRIGVVATTASRKFYINGKLHTTASTSRSQPTYGATAQFFMGEPWSMTRNPNCLIDDGSVWNRALSDDEMLADYRLSLNGYPGVLRRISWWRSYEPDTPANAGLLTGLVAHWPLNELSGDALDLHASNDLSVSGAVGNSSAVWGTVRDLESGSSQYFFHNDNATLSTGDVDWSLSLWINTESITNSQTFASKWNTTGNQREWILQYSTASARWEFTTSNDGSAVDLLSNNSVSHANSTWFHLVIVHDATNNEKRLYVNNTKASKSYSSGVFDSTAQFRLGANQAFGQFHDGLMSSASFWKNRALTDSEVTSLYNSGSPLPYSSYSSVGGGGGTANPWYYYQMLAGVQ